MLFAARYEGKMTLLAIVGLVVVVALLVYAPIAIVREIRRPVDEELPEWMGTARGRKLRFAITLAVLGVLGAVVWVVMAVGQP